MTTTTTTKPPTPQKSKNRFGIPDVVRMSHELNSTLSGMWVQNIYTTAEDSSKTFIFKMTSSHSAEGKVNLVMESGVRFHTTEYEREKSTFPAPFAMKLRKHIREKRLLHVKQIGMDRVIDFCFGKGDHVFHVVLELYASGNIILTDASGKILSLLRVYTVEEASAASASSAPSDKNNKNEIGGAGEIDKRRVAVGEIYPLAEDSIVSSSISLRILASVGNDDGFDKELAKDLSAHLASFLVKPSLPSASSSSTSKTTTTTTTTTAKGGNKKETKPIVHQVPKETPLPLTPSFAVALTAKGSPYQAFGPQIIEECLLKMDIEPDSPAPSNGDDELLAFVTTLNPLLKLTMEELARVGEGYLIRSGADGYFVSFEPFVPWKLRQKMEEEEEEEALVVVPFPSFSKAVDEYFSKLESQRWEKSKLSTASAAMSKVEAIRKAQEERVGGLLEAVSTKEQLSQALLANVTAVDQAIAAVNSLVAQGMKWEDVGAVVQSEKMRGNRVASIIRALHLDRNAMAIALPELPPKETVEIDLSLSAYANASNLFAEKKAAARKAEVTTAKAKEAIKALAAKAEKTIEKTEAGAGARIRQAQKQHWFEKFHWFATSEGVLVIAGRDAQQNELIVKRYLRAGLDAYMHADMHGAPSCVVRNPSRTRPLPESSLEQAALFCVCKSPAWAAKVIPAAWWVYASQVSKTAPTGEFLPTGSFMVRGKKNYIQPSRLEMGFGYLFKVDMTACSEASRAVKEKEWRYLREVMEENKTGGGGGPSSSSSATSTTNTMTTLEAENEEEVSIVGALPIIPTLEKIKEARKGGGDANKTKSKTTPPPPPPSSNSNPKHHHNLKRKKKKAEKKYKDQDEEERRLRLIALGYKPPASSLPSTATATETAADRDDDKGEEEEEEEEEGISDLNARVDAVVIEEEREQLPAPRNVEEESEEEDAEEGEETAVPLNDNNNGEDGAVPTNDEQTLLGYTAFPASDDVILHAMPFCGPIAAMGHFKFRAKLVPGTLKKSKAAKQATSLFVTKSNAREKAAMLAVGEPQVVAVMLGEVKVSAAGIEAVKAKARAKGGPASAPSKEEEEV